MVDVEHYKRTLLQLRITSLPTVLVFGDEGRELGRIEGLVTTRDLIDRLKALMPSPRTFIPSELPAADDAVPKASEEKPGTPQPGGDARSDGKQDEPSPQAGDRSSAKKVE